MLSHQPFALVLSWIVEVFDRSCHHHLRKSVEVVNIVASIILVSDEYHLPIKKEDYQWPSIWLLLPTPLQSPLLSITRSAILVLPQTQHIAGRKISGFERKSFTRQNSPDSKVFGLRVPSLNSGFKIYGDMAKPGSFYFGFVYLCVNGKTNPVLKRSGFVTNPEQFPLE